MFNATKSGQLFYGLAIIAYGIQQIVIRDFRPQIVPGFPAWAHTIVLFPLVTGLLMIAAGLMSSGMVPIETGIKKKVTLYLGYYFLALIFLSHIPYLLFVYPHKLSHLGSWGDLLKALAFCGASFIMAGSFLFDPSDRKENNRMDDVVAIFFPFGRIFFCTTIILFGCNHFVYDLSFMVPRWFGVASFWSYFGGAALIAAGCAILLNVLLKPAALLLALMLFLWFIFLHLPNAIAHPAEDRGNQIVSAFDALLFCGTALVLSSSKKYQLK